MSPPFPQRKERKKESTKEEQGYKSKREKREERRGKTTREWKKPREERTHSLPHITTQTLKLRADSAGPAGSTKNGHSLSLLLGGEPGSGAGPNRAVEAPRRPPSSRVATLAQGGRRGFSRRGLILGPWTITQAAKKTRGYAKRINVLFPRSLYEQYMLRGHPRTRGCNNRDRERPDNQGDNQDDDQA
ncbi:unnamed protein product [Boreogadus saida]